MKPDAKTVQEIRLKGIVWHVAFPHTVMLEQWLSTHYPEILGNDDRLMKKDKGSRVAAAGGLVLKERTARKGRSGARFGIRRSGSGRMYSVARDLVRAGVKTPRPVAWATVRKFGLRVRDYFVTEEIPSPVHMKEILKDLKDAPEERERVMRKLGALVGSFHVNGFSNRDLKDENILVTGDDDSTLWAVDLDGVREMKVSIRRAVKDLWPVVRSLKMHDLGDTKDKGNILEGYNEIAALMLRLEMLPDKY